MATPRRTLARVTVAVHVTPRKASSRQRRRAGGGSCRSLPLGQSLRQVRVASVAQELVELLLIRAVRALDLAIELRRAGLDVCVLDPLIGQVPVKQRLKLMPAVRPHGFNPEGELLDDVVDEGDRVLLRVAPVDLEGPRVASSIAVYW
jgi:hypothetical protein